MRGNNWQEILSLLVRPADKPKEAKRDNRSCPLLDTVFFGNDGSVEWFYTTKSGAVRTKSREAASIEKIASRFSSFALANPNNENQLVGTINVSGYKQYLKADALQELLSSNVAALKQPNAFLQVYLRPLKGRDSIVIATLKNQSVSMMVESANGDVGNVTTSVERQVHNHIQDVSQQLVSNRNLRLLEAKMSFVVDDNEQIWLTHISDFSYEENTNKPEIAKNYGNGERDQHELPMIQPPSRPSSKQQQSHPTPQQQQALSSETAPSSSSGPPQFICSFIERERDGVYRTALCVDELPGLRAWVPASNSHGSGAIGQQWTVDLDEYTRPLASPVAALESLREQRGRQNHELPLSSVITAGRVENMLLGSVSCKSVQDLVNAWRQAIFVANEDYVDKDESGNCLVCGNLYEILQKLTSLIMNDFVITDDSESPQNKRPGSVPDVLEGAFQSMSRQGSAKENMRSTLNTAGSNLNDPLMTALDDQNTQLSARSHIQPVRSMLGPDEDKKKLLSRAPGQKTGQQPSETKKATQLQQSKDAPSSSAFEQRYEQVNALYLEEQPHLNLAPGGKKKSKGKINDSLSNNKETFKKNSMHAPPDLDMIARFAAQKEVYRQEMGIAENGPKKKSIRKKGNTANSKGAGKMKGNEEAMYGYGEDTFDAEDDSSQVRRPTKGNKKKPSQRQLEMDESVDKFPPLLTDLPVSGIPPPYHLQAMQGLGSVSSLGGGISVLSDSEASFMMRQAENGDVSQLSLAGPEDAFSVGASRGNNVAQFGGEINDKLKERIDFLEKQVAALNGTIGRRDEELEKWREKNVRLTADLEYCRREWARELKLANDDKEREIILLREAHAREMAVIAGESVVSAQLKQEGETISPKKAFKIKQGIEPPPQQEGNALLLRQLEEGREELKKFIEKAEAEKRQIQTDAASKLFITEKALKSEINEIRSKCTHFEDMTHSMKDELDDTRAEKESLSRTVQQLEASRQTALDGQAKLRADLSNMQQTMNATYRLESSQGMGVGVDVDTAIKLNEAKYDAKERQLLNKVDFLKAQLAAEQESNEELKKAIAQSKQKLDEFKEEFKNRMKENEVLKRQAVEDAEKRIEAQFEDRMSELTALQSRLAGVKSELQELHVENQAIRQREEQAKAATAKAMAHQASTRAEAESLRGQIEELRAKADEDQEKELNKHSTEAIMRRLDNERQYLKSQLSSEITHKNELQTTLTACQTQLTDMQRQWKNDVDTLRELMTSQQEEAVRIEQELMAKNTNFESENIRLTTQCKELKEAVVKLRDQYRMDQLEQENFKSYTKQLKEQIEESAQEIQSMHEKTQQKEELYQKEITALSSTINEIEDKKEKEVTKLREELAVQYQNNSQAQRGLLSLKEDIERKGVVSNKEMYLRQIIDVIRRWRRNRLFGAFKVWSTNSTLIGVAKQFREQVDGMVESMKTEFATEKSNDIEAVRNKLKNEEEARVNTLVSEYDAVIEKTRKDLDDDKVLALDEAYEEFQKHLEEEQGKWEAEKERLKQIAADDVTTAVTRKEFEIEDMKQRLEADMDACRLECEKKVEEAIVETEKKQAIEWGGIIKDEKEALNAQFVQQLVETKEEHDKVIAEAKEVAEDELRKALEEAERHLHKQLEQLREACSAEAAANEERLREEFARREENIRDEGVDALNAFKSKSHEMHEERIRELRAAWNEELSSALKAKDGEIQKIVDTKLTEQGVEHEREMHGALKLETAKWQQALRDAEKRYALEAKKARAVGYGEREKELQDEINNIQVSHAAVLNKTIETHKKAAAELISEHANTILKLQNEAERQREDALQKLERELTLKLNQEWLEKVKAKVDEAWADCESVWQTKVDKEVARLESFKKDTAKQTQDLAKERNDLLIRVEKSDEMIRGIEAVHHTELEKVRTDLENEKRAIVEKYEKQKKEIIDKYEAQIQESKDNMESSFAEEIKINIDRERDKVTEEMTAVMNDLEKEKDDEIKKLQLAYKQEKTLYEETKKELTDTQDKLQDTEDELYDEKESTKKIKRESSFNLWRVSTGVLRMQSRFKTGMEEMEQAAKDELRTTKLQAKKKYLDMKLTAINLSALLATVEISRKKIHNALVSYKTNLLIEKRTQIKVLEKDIDKLTLERDGLEETRDVVEDEISHFEGQVADLEEQIRDHNRTSTMQNGRVNVAHARKKRRLDSELENVLMQIEKKREQMVQLDEKIQDTTRNRDDKENELIDLEKDLVGVLVEQQRIVLGMLDEVKAMEEKNRTTMTVAAIEWPPPLKPTMADAQKDENFDV